MRIIDMRKRDAKPARPASPANGAPTGADFKFPKNFLTIFNIFPQNYLK